MCQMCRVKSSVYAHSLLEFCLIWKLSSWQRGLRGWTLFVGFGVTRQACHWHRQLVWECSSQSCWSQVKAELNQKHVACETNIVSLSLWVIIGVRMPQRLCGPSNRAPLWMDEQRSPEWWGMMTQGPTANQWQDESLSLSLHLTPWYYGFLKVKQKLAICRYLRLSI